MRAPERGTAMLVVVLVIAALFAGGAVVASIELGGTRAADLTKTHMTATYCAEAGLAAAAPVVAARRPLWAGSLCTTRPYATCAQPAWLGAATFNHDLDGDGVDDFEVILADNDDDAPAPNDPALDRDQQLFVVSRCLKYPEANAEVAALYDFSGPTPIRKLYLQTH